MRDVATYLDEAAAHVRAVPSTAVEQIGETLLSAAREGRQVFFAGNGGSASTASHLACDLGKTVLGPSPHARRSRFRVVSLVDNSALLTAWANDVSYESVFSEQVKMLARPGDVLVVISASGSSPNVVQAVTAARDTGVHTIGFLGCDGGRLLGLVDQHVVVDCDDYGHIESVHLVLGHLLTQWLADRLDAEAVAPAT